MRESGLSASDVAKAVGLSAPTVLALHRAFKAGGWDAVDQRARGRPRLPQSCDAPQVIVDALVGLLPEKANLGSETPALWSFESLAQWLAQQQSTPSDRRSVPTRGSCIRTIGCRSTRNLGSPQNHKSRYSSGNPHAPPKGHSSAVGARCAGCTWVAPACTPPHRCRLP